MFKNFLKKGIEIIKQNPMLLALPLLYLFPEYFGGLPFLMIGTIAFDNAVGAGVQNGSLTQTWSHTCSGSDRILIVFVRLNAGEAGLTGVTYNGVAMTRSVKLTPNIVHVAFYLVNPPTGAHNVVTTITNSGWQIVSSSVSLTGVDQTTPIDVTASKRQTTTTISNTITPTVGSTMIVSGIAVNATSRTYTAEAGSTERSDAGAQATSTKLRTEAGATTTGFTASQSSDYLLLQLAIRDVDQLLTLDLTETVTLVDSVLNKTIKSLTDAITLVDVVDTKMIFYQAISNAITIIDTITTRITAKMITETITLVDTINRLLERQLTDAITLVDSVGKSTSQALLESIILVDTITTRLTKKIVEEAITLTDTVSRSTARVLTDSITLVASVISSTTKYLSDSLSLVDSKALTTSKYFTETISYIDRLYGKLNGVNMKYVDQYADEIGTYVNQYLDI